MIKRIWHGWTTKDNADKYKKALFNEVIPGIEAKSIRGYRGIEVLRHDCEEEVQFTTIMTFDSLQSVIDFQGENYEVCYVPAVAEKVLKRWDKVVTHHEVIGEIIYE